MANEGFEEYDDDYGPLTQKQAENIADFASRRAREHMYADLGRSLVRKILYVLGAGFVALGSWLTGWVHIGPPK